jgi:CRP-like cAMP-binding protein
VSEGALGLTDTLVRRLNAIGPLSAAEKEALELLPLHVRRFHAHETVVREGDRPAQCCVVIDGWVCRTKVADNGRETILSIHLPGDMPDLQSLYLELMDHSISTLTHAVMGFVSHQSLRTLIERHPGLAGPLWRETLIDAAMFRGWVAALTAHQAQGRVAHLICMLYERLKAVGLAGDDRLPLPLTQEQLGKTLGISFVHVNRVMQALKRAGLISLDHRVLTIDDWTALSELAGFNPDYLHLRTKSLDYA